MITWAYFNTDVKYKFPAGIQPSGDLLLFGGTDMGPDENTGVYTHIWTAKDMHGIRTTLEAIARRLNLTQPIDITTFERSNVGNDLLYTSLINTIPITADRRLAAQYILGSIIAHQLLYTSSLTATYEG